MFSALKAFMSDPEIHVVSEKAVTSIDDAVAYNNSASVGSAYDSLLKLREKIEKGRTLRIASAVPQTFSTVQQFDDWVRDRYPVFVDDPYHPMFHRRVTSS